MSRKPAKKKRKPGKVGVGQGVGGGRPTKLSPELQAKICEAIRAGNYIETSAAYAGITKDTLYLWLKRGARNPRSIYRKFSDAVQKAVADAEVRDVAMIAKASATQWQASAWRLERKFPKRWGRRERLDLGEDGEPVEQADEIRIKLVRPEEEPE